MSDLMQIGIGIGIILAILLLILWYFRAPPGVGKGETDIEENIRINSSKPMDHVSMHKNDSDPF